MNDMVEKAAVSGSATPSFLASATCPPCVHQRAPRLPTLVLTGGSGSLDAYARKLAERLPVPTLDPAQSKPPRHFGLPPLSLASARTAREDLGFLRRLRSAATPLHLPNQHLGRYGRFLSLPFVITVHDLIRRFDRERSDNLIHHPNMRDRLYLGLDDAGVRRARAIIAVSETTKRDLIEHLGVDEDRVTVVYNGVDHSTFRPVERRLFDFPYLLYVGSEHPRKNLVTVLRAWKLLEHEPPFVGVRLVKVGGAGGPEAPFRKRTLRAIHELGLEGRVVFTEELPEEDLAACYAGAQCLVLPSMYEGFGLPALEAMACGCPVVVSGAGGLLEVVGDAALVLDPSSPESLAAALLKASDDATARELAGRGLRRARAFSWDRTAQETMRVYRRLAEG